MSKQGREFDWHAYLAKLGIGVIIGDGGILSWDIDGQWWIKYPVPLEAAKEMFATPIGYQYLHVGGNHGHRNPEERKDHSDEFNLARPIEGREGLWIEQYIIDQFDENGQPTGGLELYIETLRRYDLVDHPRKAIRFYFWIDDGIEMVDLWLSDLRTTSLRNFIAGDPDLKRYEGESPIDLFLFEATPRQIADIKAGKAQLCAPADGKPAKIVYNP